MVELSPHPIDVRAVEAAVAGIDCGALLSFVGTARDHNRGRVVTGLEYEAYAPMALAELGKIRAEIAERWPGVRLGVVHRVGAVALGEPAVVIVVAAAHRAEAYDASRYAIEELKSRVPVWKREHYADGTDWIANRS